MAPSYLQVTLTGAGVDLVSALGLSAGDPANACAKLKMELVPGATGPFKVQSSNAAYSATTAGSLRSLGQQWVLEDMQNKNTIHPEQYFVCGANGGDKLNIEIHRN